MFIKLTRSDGENLVLVNMDKVHYFEDYRTGSVLFFDQMDPLPVKESPDVIQYRLENLTHG